MKPIERGAVNSTAPHSRPRKRNFEKIPASPNVISDAEEFTDDLHKRMIALRNNPNARITDIQNAREDYFRSRSITLGLHDLTFDGNKDFSLYKLIVGEVKDTEKHCPEVRKLHLSIPIVGGREKWVITEILNQLSTKNKNNEQL